MPVPQVPELAQGAVLLPQHGQIAFRLLRGEQGVFGGNKTLKFSRGQVVENGGAVGFRYAQVAGHIQCGDDTFLPAQCRDELDPPGIGGSGPHAEGFHPLGVAHVVEVAAPFVHAEHGVGHNAPFRHEHGRSRRVAVGQGRGRQQGGVIAVISCHFQTSARYALSLIHI